MLLFSLVFKLFRMLKNGGKWAFRLMRGLTFVMVLMPAFLPLAIYYATSSRIRSVRYGRRARNSLDIYLPEGHVDVAPGGIGGIGGIDSAAAAAASSSAADDSARGRPVVVFFPGGAWTVGYKAWGMLVRRGRGAFSVCLF